MIIQRFSISIWFTCLFATSFSAAVFGVYGFMPALVMFIIAGIACFTTLWFAFQNRHIKNALKVPADSVAIVGMIVFIATLFESSIVVALVELLFFAQLALNLYFREHRQVYFGLVVCFVALMSGTIATFSTGYLVFIVMFGVFACLYVAECHIDQKMYIARTAIQHITTKDNPQPGTQSLEKPSSHEYTNIASHWSMIKRLTLVASILGCATIIYLIMPRFPAGNLGSSQIQGWQDYQNDSQKPLAPENTDLSEHFDDPQKPQTNSQTDNTATNKQSNNDDNHQNSFIGDGFEPNKILFYAKTNRPRYYQNKTKTYFNGRSWYALQNTFKQIPFARKKRLFELYPQPSNAQVEITIAEDLPTNIVNTNNTVSMRFPSSNLGRDYYDAVTAQTNRTQELKKGTVYQLNVFDEYKNKRLIDTLQAPPDGKDIQLPHNLDPRITQLAQTVVKPEHTNWQKALLLERYMQTEYTYSLSTFANQNNIPVSQFLFETKTGHCEYLATGLALLLRTQNIPARFVTGFAGRDYNPVTGFYEIKAINGHAWVEAYVDGAWIILEPSVIYDAIPNEVSTHTSIEDANKQIQEYIEQLEEQQELQEHKPKTVMQQLTDMLMLIVAFIQQAIAFLKVILPYICIFGLLTVALWFMAKHPTIVAYTQQRDKQKKLRLVHRNLQQYTPYNTKEDAQFYIQCLQEILSIQGLTRKAGTTIEEFAHTLIEEQYLNHEESAWLIRYINNIFYTQEHTYIEQQNSMKTYDTMQLLVSKIIQKEQ